MARKADAQVRPHAAHLPILDGRGWHVAKHVGVEPVSSLLGLLRRQRGGGIHADVHVKMGRLVVGRVSGQVCGKFTGLMPGLLGGLVGVGFDAQGNGGIVAATAQGGNATVQQVVHHGAVKTVLVGPFAYAFASGDELRFDLFGGHLMAPFLRGG